MSDAEVLYRPSPWQARFANLTVDEALGAGAAGPGKSMCLLMNPINKVRIEEARIRRDPRSVVANEESELFQLILNNPLRRGHSKGWCLHLRRTFKMLDQTLVRAHRIFPMIDEGVKWHSDNYTFVFSSGYRYQFGHCQHSEDWQNYQSSEYDEILFDELVQFEFEQFEQIGTRLRSSDPVLMRMLYVRSMSNPVLTRNQGENFTVTDPFWVRKRYVDDFPAGGVIMRQRITHSDGTADFKTRIYLPARLSDNPDANYVYQYERTLLPLKPSLRRALMDGDWYVSAYAFFADEWEAKLHVCRPFKIPDDWRQVRGMDWGYKTNGAIYWGALDHDGTLWIHKEYWFKGRNSTQVALDIKAIEQDLGLWNTHKDCSKITGPADTQLWEQRGERGKSKAEEMAACGVNWTKADKRSRQRNAERVAERLSDHDNGTKTPGLVIFQGCKMLIKTIPSLRSEDGHPNEPAKGGDDHGYDALSYLVGYCSRPGVGRCADDDEDEFADEGVEETDRGEHGYG